MSSAPGIVRWAAQITSAALLLLACAAGVARAQAPFLARGEDAVLFGGVYSHDLERDGRDALGAGVGFTVASWSQFEASIARVGGEPQTSYGLGVELYPLRLWRDEPVEPFVGFGWSHTAIFSSQTVFGGASGLASAELDIFPLTAGVSARVDVDRRLRASAQIALLQVGGDRGPDRPGRTGWLAAVGLCGTLSSGKSLCVVPTFSEVYGRVVGSVLVGLQFVLP